MTLVYLAALAGRASAQSNIDADHKFAWGENMGWTNWRDANSTDDGVVVGTTFLSGYIWGENVGWINVGNGNGPYGNNDDTDFGVNIDPDTGDLSGFAWGENIGWINFDGGAMADPPQPANLEVCDHRFSGYAWGENVGWINLDDAEHYVALGPCDFGDADCDGDVDVDDFERFLEVFTGPQGSLDCPTFDSDNDNDVDFADFASFQEAFTG
jgi:hypothetical protein